MTCRCWWRWCAIAAVALAGGTSGWCAADAVPAVVPWETLREKTFAEVWETVNEAYYDITFGGVNWAEVRDRYRGRLTGVGDKPKLRELLTAMLAELHRSHFSILPREAAVFTPAERKRTGTIGAGLACDEEGVLVRSVAPGSSAESAGLKPGDRVLAIDGFELRPFSELLKGAGQTEARRRFYLLYYVKSRSMASVGTAVKCSVAGPTEKRRDIVVACRPNDGRWSEPIGYFPSFPIEITATRANDGMSYLAFNVFSPILAKEVRVFLRGLQTGDGLVIDLRGNPGGVALVASGIAGCLTVAEFSLGTMHLRKGQISFEVAPQSRAFLGPIAVLIDSGSASTSEIFAAGLQAAKRARVFGETSAGQALPSSFKTLPTGDIFQFAIADLKTSGGQLLEGRGVSPDEQVPCTQADLAAGRDPVLAAAHRWIDRERGALAARAGAASNPTHP